MTFSSYPEYKSSGHEWVGEIPSHWLIYRSKNIFSERNVKALESDEQLTASQKYGVIPQKLFSALEDQKVMQVILGRDILKKAEINDFVISMRSFQGGLEFCSYSGAVSSAYVPLFANREIDNRFFKHLFKSIPFISALQNTSNLVRDGQALRYNNFVQLSLPFPSLNEQRTIGAFLDHETARIDALIEEQQRLIELLKEKRQAVISHAVTKGLDPTVPMKDSGVEWLGEVPAHWSFKQSKYLFEFVTSGSRGWAEYYSDDGDLFFRIANLTRDSIEPKLASIQYVTPPENAEGERSKVRCGDILISITADLGSVCVASDEVAGGYVSQHVALARPVRKTVFSRWLAYFILSTTCKDQLVGAGYGGTKVQLSLEDIRSFWVSMPPYDEQISLAAFLDREVQAFDGLITQAAIGVDLLSERRSALISAAVTGKIDVRDWQPPASTQAPKLEVAEAN